MDKQFEIIRKTRTFFLGLVKDLSVDQLNTVPAGFNNNIIWNLGHLIAAQEGICYVRAGMQPRVEEEFFNSYKSGTKPEGKPDEKQINKIKELLFSSLDFLEQDYKKGLWKNYPAWTTRYGVEIKSIEDALNFLSFHEGLHTGYILSIKKLV
jgi:hypothetical protein